MRFSIPCECGKPMNVSEGSAGARILCDCGRTVDVPSLATLRTNAGLRPVEVPLNIEVDWLLKAGELPTPYCVGCNATGADVVNLFADCEQIYVQKEGGISWMTIIFTGIATGGRLFAWFDQQPVLHGRETVIRVPARMCDSCRESTLRPPSTVMLSRLSGCLIVLAFVTAFVAHWSVPLLIAICCALVGLRESKLRAEYQRHVKSALSSIPLYKKIFEKYPDAIVSTGSTS